MKNFDELLVKAKEQKTKTIIVTKAEDSSAMLALKKACDEGFARGVLVGEKAVIEKKAKELNFVKGLEEIIDIKDPADASNESVKLISKGRGDILLKGSLHTDILLSAALNKEWGLRTSKMLSHVLIIKVPAYHKLLFITDAAMNIAPDLECKKHILQNAVDLAGKLQIQDIKAACLASIEDVNPKMQCTIDAAALSKMADRGQIMNAKVDGPLAFDIAISPKAVEIKGIKSRVAGDADILLVPHIEAGNILFKGLVYFAEDSTAAGIILGAKCPIALLSRADSDRSKFYSLVLCALSAN